MCTYLDIKLILHIFIMCVYTGEILCKWEFLTLEVLICFLISSGYNLLIYLLLSWKWGDLNLEVFIWLCHHFENQYGNNLKE